MTEQQLREQLYASFRNRAMLYYHIFDELRKELGEPQATEILKRAIQRRGEEIGLQFVPYGPDNLQGLRDAFLQIIPDGGCMFAPRVDRCDDQQLDITLQSCPLRDAWLDAGLDQQEVAKLCDIAAAVDTGTFQGAGFQFSADTWQPACEGCCHLHIRPGPGV